MEQASIFRPDGIGPLGLDVCVVHVTAPQALNIGCPLGVDPNANMLDSPALPYARAVPGCIAVLPRSEAVIHLATMGRYRRLGNVVSLSVDHPPSRWKWLTHVALLTGSMIEGPIQMANVRSMPYSAPGSHRTPVRS